MSEITIARLDPARPEPFFRLHSPENGHGWCRCVAWWVPTWEGWGERTEEENRRLRESLFARGEQDIWLLTVGGAVAASAQACPRDRLAKLGTQFALPPDPGTWAIGCFFVAPAFRRQGLTRRMLGALLVELARLGAKRVEAFPRRGEGLEPGEMWTGPEPLYRAAGFREVPGGDARRLVLALDLPPQSSLPGS